MKKLGFTVLQGIAFGLGLVILLVSILTVFGAFSFSTPFRSEVPPELHKPALQQPTGPTADQLVVSNTNAILPSPNGQETQSKCGNTSGQISFTGTIENKGPDSEKYLNVYADLFDTNGAFIFQCQTQFMEGLKNGAKQNFIINCYNWPKEIADKYSSFKIYARGS
ncbi:FxLYD domain-containing protein [Hydrogenophaga pseudoflava]|uniref:FxLYD domain-containing protein n=1 Tax=Hydrogenophaga pseudoflava TaxID=47421 RepID=UPI0010570848|nr:FxLYD domain-containing protein [Hydrogenophaga pseudoflava]